MNWQNQKVLVTGAGGFVGSHLVERLMSLGAETKALVRYNSAGTHGWLDSIPVKDHVEIFAGDVRDEDGLQELFRGVDMVFNLAALISIPYSYENPRAYVRTNVEGALNVFQAAREADVSLVVQTSTSEVYGSALYTPMDEKHPLQAQSPYAATKIAADKLAESYYRCFDLPVAIIRPFNTYGPRQSARAIIPAIISQAITGSHVKLGNLTPERDFNFVTDTVDGYIRIAECPEAKGKVINIGGGSPVSIGTLASTILELMGRDIPIVQDEQRLRPKDSEVDRLCSDSTLARNLLGWAPQHTMKSGLALAADWIRDNIDSFPEGVYST